MKRVKVMVSGGGTGGHIFPAISIANMLKKIEPNIEILFVGALGKMEMERVPAAGYKIEGLPVVGLQRSLSLSNLKLPFKILKSIKMAGKIIDSFKPDVVVGVGGYASAPLLWASSKRGIPCLIQEQNSYAGLTNKILSKRVARICVAYNNMERFFPKDKIILTGNPIRGDISKATPTQREEGYKFYQLNPNKRTIFVVGGSLGSKTLNESVKALILERGTEIDYQIIWQHGKYYKADIELFMSDKETPSIKYFDFIQRMDLAFAVSDLIITRAGAGTISELCVAEKASIFVPSPNVTEDHQTHNAMALVNVDAAEIVKDVDAVSDLMSRAEALLNDRERLALLEQNIAKLAKPNAAEEIAVEVLNLIKRG